MKLHIDDSAHLDAITPIDLLGYLRAHGWCEARRDSNAALWTFGSEEALVPLKPAFRDYARRVLETIRTLAVVEDRSELAVFRDVKAASADVIRIRAVAPDFSSGTMPVGEALALVERSRELLLAAACAASSKRSVFHSRKPNEATAFMQRVRMGQTELGSYVVTLQAPVPPALQQQLPNVAPSVVDEPFERRSTTTLLTALHALQGAVESSMSTGSQQPFSDAVAGGVSANLCEAIVDLYAGCRADAIELAINWAAVRPPLLAAMPTRITLAREWVEPLKTASSLFRAQQPEQAEVVGYVVKLEKSEREPRGVATLYGDVAGSHRRVRLELSASDYATAIEAHRDGTALRAKGELAKDGRSWLLRAPVLLGPADDVDD